MQRPSEVYFRGCFSVGKVDWRACEAEDSFWFAEIGFVIFERRRGRDRWGGSWRFA